jgi:hypothetical protein
MSTAVTGPITGPITGPTIYTEEGPTQSLTLPNSQYAQVPFAVISSYKMYAIKDLTPNMITIVVDKSQLKDPTLLAMVGGEFSLNTASTGVSLSANGSPLVTNQSIKNAIMGTASIAILFLFIILIVTSVTLSRLR